MFANLGRVLTTAGITFMFPAIYVVHAVVNAQLVAFSRPFSATEVALGMVAVVAWVLVAGTCVAAVTGALFPRIGGVFAGLAATLAWTLPLASMQKMALLGQPLTTTDMGFVTRYALSITDPIGAIVLGVGVAFTTLVAMGLGAGARSDSLSGEQTKRFRVGGVVLVLFAVVTLSVAPRAREFAATTMPEALWLLGSPDRDLFVRYERLDLSDAAVTGGRIGGWQAPVGWAQQRHPNVIIIMIDGVRHAHLGVGGGRQGVTPHIDALAQQSVVFSHAYTPATHSDYAQTAMLSGLHPRKFRGHDYFSVNYPRALVWDVLQPLGYKTGVFSTHNEHWGDMLKFLKTPHVDVFKHAPDWPNAPKKGRGSDTAVPESVAVGSWLNWRKRHPGRHLSYLNFQVTHFPYTLPPHAEAPFAPHNANFNISFVRYPREAVPVMKNRFLNALHHADKWVGEIVRSVKQSGEWDNTVIIVASDHGEAFYEHSQPTHGTSLYQEQVESMLIARLPGMASRTYAGHVSLIDAVPSLLEHLGLPPHPAMQGRRWLFRAAPPTERRCEPRFFTIQGLASMDGAVDCRFKVISDTNRRGVQCFDLAQDPGEKRDVWANGKHEQCASLMGRLLDFLDRQTTYYDRKLWSAGWHARPMSAWDWAEAKEALKKGAQPEN